MTQLDLNTLGPALANVLLHEDQGRFTKECATALARMTDRLAVADVDTDSMATAFYYAMPLPGRGFEAGKMPAPGRNEPCSCGSGKKYKQCCARVGPPPVPPGEVLFQLAIHSFDEEHWFRLGSHPALPATLREQMLVHCVENDQLETVQAIAQPMFQNIESLKNRDQASFSMALDAMVVTMPGAERGRLLEALLGRARASGIKSILLQRLAMRCMDGNDTASAEQYLARARKAEPNQVELPLTELCILAATAPEQELKARARWWQKSLSKRYGPDHDLADLLDDIAARGQAAIDPSHTGLGPGGAQDSLVQARLSQLHDLLAEADSGVTDTATKLSTGEATVKTRKNLATPARQFLATIYQLDQTTPAARLNYNHLVTELADSDATWTDPAATWPALLEANPGLLGNATVLWALYNFIPEAPVEHPEGDGFAPMAPLIVHINHYLANLLATLEGRATLSRRTLNGDAIALLMREHMFDLRAMNEPDMAMAMGEQYIKVNPGDPTGVRNLLASLYAEYNKLDALTALKKRYREKQTPELLLSLMQLHATQQRYGQALVLLNQLMINDASAFRQFASDVRNPVFINASDGYSGVGAYWAINRPLWNESPDAMAWLERNLP